MRRVALVGTAASSTMAPFHDPEWSIWGVSSRHKHVTRATRWLEMHRLDGEPADWAKRWREQLKTSMADIPELMMLYPERDLAPNVTQYPYQRIVDRFQTYFMTSTFSWMMALAIDEMVPLGTVAQPGTCEIGLWGVDMEHGTEYAEQRAGLRHFMALAQALGITVSRLTTSGIAFEPVPYPLWQDDPLLCKLAMRTDETVRSIDTFEKSLVMTRNMIAQNNAVRGLLDQIAREGAAFNPEQRRRELDRELDGLMGTSAQLSRDLVHWSAIHSEQKWLRGYLSP